MRFLDFARSLRNMGATMSDVYRLDREGRAAATDAHDAGQFRDWNEYHSFCANIGRQFVIDNIGELFEI